MTGADQVATLRHRVARYLNESDEPVPIDADGDFVVRRGDVVTWVRPAEVAPDRTAVLIWSIAAVDVRVDDRLTGFLATEEANLPFGHFELCEARPSIHVAHALLGDTLAREELRVAVDEVTRTSDHYGRIIRANFGGSQLRTATPPARAVTPPRPDGWHGRVYVASLALAAVPAMAAALGLSGSGLAAGLVLVSSWCILAALVSRVVEGDSFEPDDPA